MTAKSTPDIGRVIAGYKGCVTRAQRDSQRKIRGILIVLALGILGIIIGYYVEEKIGFPTIYTALIFVLIGGIIAFLLD
jgi:hypothetical protein